MESGFSKTSKETLEGYVYGLIDPRNSRIFYVGKASANNRAFDHFKANTSEGKKRALIDEIRKETGNDPWVEVLRSGLTTEQAFEVEATVIDALGLENLTNAVRGRGTERGRVAAADFERMHGARPLSVTRMKEPIMLFFINQTFSATASEVEIYDCVRQFWQGVAEKKRTPDECGDLQYPDALALVESVVVRAYRILQWFPAASTLSTRSTDDARDKWEFVGQLNPTSQYLGRRLTTADGTNYPHNQKGYGYIN